MHIKKNICDSIIGTFLNIPGKTKDSFASRLDLVEIGVRPELASQFNEKRTYLPTAYYNLKKEEKHRIRETLANIKVPDGYSLNVCNLISIKDLRLIGLKYYDCHAMQQLLSVALRAID